MLIFYIALTLVLLYCGYIIFLTGVLDFLPLSRDEATAVKVSVVVPARNESQNLEAFFSSIRSLDFPQNQFELIVVNDHSADPTAELLHLHASENTTVITNLGQGKKAALKTGISHARHPWIATTDADCQLPKNWLTQICKNILAYPEAKFFTGPVLLSPISGFFERMQALEFFSLIASAKASLDGRLPLMANGANLIFNRKAYFETLPQRRDEALPSGDDMFLMEAINKKYGRGSCRFLKGDAVKTPHAQGFYAWWNQRTRWAGKSTAYQSRYIKIVALLVLAVHIALLATFVFSFSLGLLLLVPKMFVDFIFLKRASRAIPIFISWRVFAVQAGWAVVSTPVVAFASLFFRGRWKGRRRTGRPNSPDVAA